MQAGAAYTNAMRVAKTKEQVLKGIRTALADPGATLTPVLIARQTGLNIKTVRNYFPEMLKIAGNLGMVFKTPVKPEWRERCAAGTMAS